MPRPTPQRENRENRASDELPRFKDRLPEEYGGRTDVNPFLARHANFGPPLLTADQAWRFRGHWEDCFGRKAPLHVEIGPGNGFFLTEVSRRNPEVNVLGLEIRYKRTVMCATKLVRAGIENARIIRYHAGFLDDLFVEGSVDALYINHPDPWPKERHEKNRLISRWFLEDAARLLRPGAPLRLKSDYRDNVYRVPKLLEADGEGNPAPKLPFTITGICEDVITLPAPWPDDIETNYQSKYRKKGEPVYGIEIVRT